jgi:hypothetical protein
MTPGPGSPYKVACPGKELDRLKAWANEASELGIREAFIAALKTINERLTTDPLGWGDPYFHLRQLGVLLCHGTHAMIHVYFAVDEAKKIVYVKEFRPMPGGPLDRLE